MPETAVNRNPADEADDACFVIHGHEIKKLEEVRKELHEYAAHNPQLERHLQVLTAKLWPIINKKREVVNKPS